METGNYQNVADATEYTIGQADYLIVTNPLLLFGYNIFWWDDVDVLLSKMAHLAYLKGGVLGYLETYDTEVLHDLTRFRWFVPNWRSRLNSDFRTTLGGYMLIVGVPR